jgi:hypothetical protein
MSAPAESSLAHLDDLSAVGPKSLDVLLPGIANLVPGGFRPHPDVMNDFGCFWPIATK